MKDEIKEIIESLLYLCDLPEDVTYSLNKECIEKVRDCIINLREENRILKENAEHNDKVVDNARWNEMIYKSRNEKAIKLLKEAGCYEEDTKTFCDDVWEELPKLLDTLQGDDDNEQTR